MSVGASSAAAGREPMVGGGPPTGTPPAGRRAQGRAHIAALRSRGRLRLGDGVAFGAGVQVHVDPGAHVWLGDGVTIGAGSRLVARAGELRIEYGVVLGDGCVVHVRGSVTIGAGARLADRVTLTDAEPVITGAPAPPVPRPGAAASVRIGPRVAIGPHTFVGAGVTIGEDAQIGARLAVEHDVAAGARVDGRRPPSWPFYAIDEAPVRLRTPHEGAPEALALDPATAEFVPAPALLERLGRFDADPAAQALDPEEFDARSAAALRSVQTPTVDALRELRALLLAPAAYGAESAGLGAEAASQVERVLRAVVAGEAAEDDVRALLADGAAPRIAAHALDRGEAFAALAARLPGPR